jgi:hypothetical protein
MTLFLSHLFGIATRKCLGLTKWTSKAIPIRVHSSYIHTLNIFTMPPLPTPPQSIPRKLCPTHYFLGGGVGMGCVFPWGCFNMAMWEWSEVAIARPTFGAAKRCRLEWMVQATIVKYVAILYNKSFHMGVSYWRVHGTVVKCAQIVWNNLFYMECHTYG